MPGLAGRAGRAGLVLVAVVALAGCQTAGPRIPPAGMVEHVVRPGETVWRISQRYGSSVAAVQRANGLDDPTQIRVGQRLRVPAGVQRVGPAGAAGARTGAGGRARAARVWSGNRGGGRSAGVPKLVWPVKGPLTSRFGMRRGAHHDGIDIDSGRGTPVLAAEAGRVVHADDSLAGYGNLVIVKHAGRLSTVYAHNRRILVTVGQFVRKGQRIAEVGQSGRASAPHLHFEVRSDGTPVDPLDYLR